MMTSLPVPEPTLLETRSRGTAFRGRMLLASWPKPQGGSGSPARAVAIHLPSPGSGPEPR